MFTWTLAYYISEWIIRLIMPVFVIRRRRPASAMAWLLVIFFQPWIGLALYGLIGRIRLPWLRKLQYARLINTLTSKNSRFHSNRYLVQPSIDPGFAKASRLAHNLGKLPILNGNCVEMLDETNHVLDRLIADINSAEYHIHLLFYIFADDETGQRVVEALSRAVLRGVKCRVLADSVGSRPMFKTLGPKMRKSGIELREALPAGLFRRQMARIDLRNHRKLAIIDGQIAYTGSQNLINACYGQKDMLWHDLMVRITGPAVHELQIVFLIDWDFVTNIILDSDDIFPEVKSDGNIAVQSLPSGPNYPTENYQRMIVAAIHSAEQRVTITTPYFVPTESLTQALQTAALRGVEVELIVPKKNNKPLVGAASAAYYDELLEAGVKLYLFNDGLLHTKAMNVDDVVAFVGSSNFDIRSFSLNFEISLLLYGPLATKALRAKQDQYLQNSTRLNAEQWARRPLATKIFQNIAKLLSPLL